MTKHLTTAELQRIIARWDDGSGVTVTVQAFALSVPVAERTVCYWIGGRTIHAAIAERITAPSRRFFVSRSRSMLSNTFRTSFGRS